MIKGFRQIASLTVFSRMLGMVRDMAFAHFFGAGWLMTAWTMGFKLPNLSRRLFGEGAAAASFIPVYSEQLHQDPAGAKKLANTVVTVIFVLLTAVAIIIEIALLYAYKFMNPPAGARMGILLSSIMLPYMVFVCVVAMLAGILQVHRHFAAPAAAPALLNIIVIASILFTALAFNLPPERQVLYVAAGVVLAGLAQVGLQMGPLHSAGVSVRPAWDIRSESFRKIIILMVPMLLGQTVTQINTLADDLIALAFSSNDGHPLGWGAVSHLYYAQRLYQFPLGVLGISLATAIFPVMSADAARKDYHALCITVSRGLAAAIFIALPATVGILLVAGTVVSVVFEHGHFTHADTQLTSWTLSFYALGLCGYFCQQISTRAFYSTQHAICPVITALVAVFVNVILNLILLWFLGTGGLALSTALCSYLQVSILIFVLHKRYGRSILAGVKTAIIKTAIGAAAMAIVGWSALLMLRNIGDGDVHDLIRLAVVIPLSGLVYVVTAKLLRNEMLSLLIGKAQA